MRDLPKKGRLLGVDYGTVRIGLAITDPEQRISSPLQIYHPSTPSRNEKYFVDVVRQESVAGIVVGLPVHLSGRESAVSVAAENFARWLEKVTTLPVVLFDERFTTAFAEELVREMGLTKDRKRKVLDKLAAQILLSSFLESDRNGPPQAVSDL